MKTITLLLALALPGAAGAFAAADKAESTQVQVMFFEAEKFTDVKESSMATDKGRDAILKELRTYIVERAEKVLPPGYKLSVTFLDVDLAGDYEPWRGPRLDDVRIVKDIYPPRFKLSFRVTDEAGAVVKEGQRQLSDLAFMSRLTINRHDTLRYEKEMLNDWIRNDVRVKL